MQTFTLNNGVQIPVLGFGVFQIPPAESAQAVAEAIKAGYRHIDTAQAYMNEAEVGQGVKQSGVGANDGIAAPHVMRRRIEQLKAMGVPTEFHEYPRLGHGFALGSGTSAAGWEKDALAFWQKQMR